jgi:hypothetical protein
MKVKTTSLLLILMILNDIFAGPYSFQTLNGKNELVIDDDYLESKKEMEIRKLKESQLKALKKKRKKIRMRKLKKKKRKAKIKRKDLLFLCILLYSLFWFQFDCYMNIILK